MYQKDELVKSNASTVGEEPVVIMSYSMAPDSANKVSMSVLSRNETTFKAKAFQYEFLVRRTDEGGIIIGDLINLMPNAQDLEMENAKVIIDVSTHAINVYCSGLHNTDIFWHLEAKLCIIF